MAQTRFLNWIGSLGVDKAPEHQRERVRAANLKVVTDVAFGCICTVLWAGVGVWKLFLLSALLQTIGPIALALNAFGFFKTARMVVTTSFAIVVAICSLLLGSSLGTEVFLFAGLVSIYANYEIDEKRERTTALAFSIGAGLLSHVYARNFSPLVATPERWTPYIEFVVWIAAIGMTISQIQIFMRRFERSQASLREQQELTRAAFEQAATGLNIVGADGRFLKVNPEMCRLLGLSAEELMVKSFRDLTSPEDQETTARDVDRLKRREIETLKKEKKYRHKAGHYITTHLQARALYDDSGKLKYFISSVQDLTERKLAEQKLLQASKMSSLGEMAGSIAHEINTPLAIIQLAAEQIEDPEIRDQLSADQVSALTGTISDTVHRVAKIVKGLKSFARNADQDPLQTLTVKEIVSDSLDLCLQKFKNNGVELSMEIDPHLAMRCRPIQISQVVLNLLSNAIDAVNSAKEKWVRVEASQRHGLLTLRIIDSGPGIPTEIADRILEPFFTTKKLGEGTGLGLSISKGIAESHGGRLYLDRTHRNTCFVIELPATDEVDARDSIAVA